MEDFVTFEIAQKLKEKGFDYPCVGHYVNHQLYIAHYQNAFHSDNYESLDAPTISQVLKWLRDEKNIHIEIYTCASGYDYIISNTPKLGGSDRHWSECEGPNDGGCWDFYEQAAIAGIKYVLDNLI